MLLMMDGDGNAECQATDYNITRANQSPPLYQPHNLALSKPALIMTPMISRGEHYLEGGGEAH